MLSHGERKNKRKGKRLGENGKKMKKKDETIMNQTTCDNNWLIFILL